MTTDDCSRWPFAIVRVGKMEQSEQKMEREIMSDG